MNLTSLMAMSTNIILSTSMILLTTHWLMTWVCLEINTMSMTAVISNQTTLDL